MTPTEDAYANVNRMKPMKGESAEDFANRMYSMQMEVFSAWAGHDLFTPFFTLPKKVQNGWIEKAKEKMS